MNKKVYLAHNFKASVWLREEVVPILTAAEVEVTSRWLNIPQHLQHSYSTRSEALMDLRDIRSANALFFFCDQFGEAPGRGKYFELGFALAKGIPAIVIGSEEQYNNCVFNLLFDRVSSIQEAIEWLKA